ncbi:MAG: helix-turn-helix domain-containing protein [Pseudomonadota bacterium]
MTSCDHKADTLARRCAHCSLRRLCLPAGIDREDLPNLEKIVRKSPPIDEGSFLFHAGEESHGVYVVRFGSFKSIRMLANGDEQIVGVHLPGEVFGLDGMANRRFNLDSVALEKSGVCSVSFDQLESIFDRFPTLNRQVMGMMSREVSERHSHQVLMGRRSAVERVALFLLRYSERLESRGFVGTSFALSLSRQDLANYLGLQIETVSRTIGKLKEQNILEVDRRLISIESFEHLRDAAGVDQGEAVSF